jgi:hypothetical protein
MVITTSHNDIKERLSIAYITAVAARAGCQVVKLDIDKESIDAMIRPVSGSKSQIDLQLKATSLKVLSDDSVKFSLPIKNYDNLRDLSSIVPHYLVILNLPEQEDAWLEVRASDLVLRGAAYYGSLYGHSAVSNTASRTVVLPQTQRFDVEVLRKMILSSPDKIGIIEEHKDDRRS